MLSNISFLVIIFFVLINLMIFMLGLREINIKDKSSIEHARRYYFGNKGRMRYTRNVDYSTFFFDVFWKLFVYLMLLLIIFNIMLVIYESLPNIWINTGKYIDELPQLMLNTFLGIFAIIGILTAINKKHFITFNIIDVLESYKIKEKIINMICLVGITYVIFYVSILMRNINIQNYYFSLKSLIFINFIFFLWIALRTCWISGSICTSNPRFELKVLDNLHKNFWYSNIKLDTDKWDMSGVEHITEYLILKYKKSLNRVSLDKVEKVSYVSTLDNIETSYLQYRAVPIFYLFAFFSFSLLILLVQINSINYLVITCVIMCLITCSIAPFRKFATIIVYFKCGYLIKYISKKQVYISSSPFLESRWSKYIQDIQNILAFYKISINKDENELIEQTLIENIYSSVKLEDDHGILLFLLMYIKYEKNEDMQNVYEAYKSIIGDNIKKFILDKKSISYKIMNAIISDINKDVKYNRNNNIVLANFKLYKFRRELKIYSNND